MTETDIGALSRDDFLGGALRIWQPRGAYRAGIDPVLLAASVPAKPGQSVLDLGCGVFVAGLCLSRRVPGVDLTGLEISPVYADLAQRNADSNGIAACVIKGDLAQMPAILRRRQFDHVLANPPYFDRQRGTPAKNTLRETALGEETPLATWIAQAAKRARPGGSVTFIQQAARLPELLSCAPAHLGSLEVLPLLPRVGRSARLVLMRGRRGGRAAFRLHAGRVLHDGETHLRDGDDYATEVKKVLRDCGELNFPK